MVKIRRLPSGAGVTAGESSFGTGLVLAEPLPTSAAGQRADDRRQPVAGLADEIFEGAPVVTQPLLVGGQRDRESETSRQDGGSGPRE